MQENFSLILETYGLSAFAGLFAFAVTFSAIPAVIKLAQKRSWLDEPDHRKTHKIPVPRLGGAAICLGIAVAISFCLIAIGVGEVLALIPGFGLIAVAGLWDDLKGLPALKKLAIQCLAALSVLLSDFKMDLWSEQGFLFDSLEWTLTFGVLIFLTNAFNLIDGVDGLAAGLGIISLSSMGVLMYIQGDAVFAALFISSAGSYLAFFLYNREPAILFMGDLGSLMLGFLMALGLVRLMQGPVSQLEAFRVGLPLALVAIPTLDALRVMFYRLAKRQSPFSADRSHIHHILVRNGFRHKTVSRSIYLLHFYLIGLTVLGNNLSLHWIIPVQVAGFSAGLVFFIGLRWVEINQQRKKLSHELELTQSKNPFSTI